MDIQKYINSITAGEDSAAAAQAMAARVHETIDLAGMDALIKEKPLNLLLDATKDKAIAAAVYQGFAAVCHKSGRVIEPIAVPLIPDVLKGAAEKEKATVKAAVEAAQAIVDVSAEWATPMIVELLLGVLSSKGVKPAQKEAVLKLF